MLPVDDAPTDDGVGIASGDALNAAAIAITAELAVLGSYCRR